MSSRTRKPNRVTVASFMFRNFDMSSRNRAPAGEYMQALKRCLQRIPTILRMS